MAYFVAVVFAVAAEVHITEYVFDSSIVVAVVCLARVAVYETVAVEQEELG